MKTLLVFILPLMIGNVVSSNTYYWSTSSHATTKPPCLPPFEEVGGRCIIVDNFNSGSWYAMKHLCEIMGGRILTLDDTNLHRDVVAYINEHQLNHVHYWIGATDEGHEGDWRWTDGSSVGMGTPYWANTCEGNVQAPTGGTRDNCALLDSDVHFFFNDEPCDAAYSVICEK